MTPKSTDNLRDAAVKAIRTVFDPEIPVNIYELGLIYELTISDAGAAHVQMTLTSPNCPVAEKIPQQVAAALKATPGITDANVEIVWDPPWKPEMMSEAAKLELEFTGQTTPAHLRKDKFSSLTVNRSRQSRPDA